MPRISSAAVAAILLPCVCLADSNWTQFRGPSAQGITTAKGLPVTWSEKQNVTWKTPIHGKAWSSPVVWDVDLLSEEVVRVYRGTDPAKPAMYRRGQIAEAEPAVPGWRMAVDDLFPAD